MEIKDYGIGSLSYNWVSLCEAVGKKEWTGILKHRLKKIGPYSVKKYIKKDTENWEKFSISNYNDGSLYTYIY